MRTARPATFPLVQRGQDRRLPLHRGLLQTRHAIIRRFATSRQSSTKGNISTLYIVDMSALYTQAQTSLRLWGGGDHPIYALIFRLINGNQVFGTSPRLLARAATTIFTMVLDSAKLKDTF